MSDEPILDRARREPWNYGGALLSMVDALRASLDRLQQQGAENAPAAKHRAELDALCKWQQRAVELIRDRITEAGTVVCGRDIYVPVTESDADDFCALIEDATNE